MRLRYDWTPSAAFYTIDSLKEGAINHRNVASFLIINGYYSTESETIAIIRRLDLDADQKISYEEFSEGMKPQASFEDIGASSFSKSPRGYPEEEKKKSVYIPNSPLRNKSPSKFG